MVHTRSAEGHWKHTHRSWLRGFARRPGVPPLPPPVFHGVEMPPPPPPPVAYGVERRVRTHWDELSTTDPLLPLCADGDNDLGGRAEEETPLG